MDQNDQLQQPTLSEVRSREDAKMSQLQVMEAMASPDVLFFKSPMSSCFCKTSILKHLFKHIVNLRSFRWELFCVVQALRSVSQAQDAAEKATLSARHIHREAVNQRISKTYYEQTINKLSNK